MKEIVSVTSY